MAAGLVGAAGVMAGGLGPALLGCGGASNDELEEFLRSQYGDFLPATTLTLRVINQEDVNQRVVLLIDGVSQTFNCTADRSVCDFALASCPATIEAVSETRVDVRGVFVGGRTFNESTGFEFTQDDFDCGDIIIFRFSSTLADAFVL